MAKADVFPALLEHWAAMNRLESKTKAFCAIKSGCKEISVCVDVSFFFLASAFKRALFVTDIVPEFVMRRQYVFGLQLAFRVPLPIVNLVDLSLLVLASVEALLPQ